MCIHPLAFLPMSAVRRSSEALPCGQSRGGLARESRCESRENQDENASTSHHERRRADPFADVWENEVLPMPNATPGSSHDLRGHRSPPRPRHDPRRGTSTNARDNQRPILIVAPRQSKCPSRKYRLRYRHAATIILSPRPPKRPSWWSLCSHPDCRAIGKIIASPKFLLRHCLLSHSAQMKPSVR
jgi:hypothetical protein